ncbi:MAG: hypothetical protein ABJA37_14745 [Ferruginibacter sp.]
MKETKKETQYFLVAEAAYENIVNRKMDFDAAWYASAKEHIDSEQSRKKVCPRSTFIGLCESGDLKDIKEIKQSDSINYLYAKFAIAEWKKDQTITKSEMWNRVLNKFGKAKNHQGQLDVVMGVKKYWQ